MKSAKVNCDGRRSTELLVSADRVGWRDVHRPHEPFGEISSDGQKGETNFRKPPPDFAEMRSVAGISREINYARWTLNHVPAPKSFVSIAQSSTRKMPSRNTSDLQFFCHHRRLPPIQLADLVACRNLVFFKPRAHAKRYNKLRLPLRTDSPLRGNIKMVVVIVALQHNIDGRQIFESNPRCAMPLRSDPRKRTGAH